MEVDSEPNVPQVDFSFQFSAQREYLKVEKKIFNCLVEVAKKNFSEKKSCGALIVYGNFYLNENHIIEGMRQIGINPIQKFMSFGYANLESEISKLIEENYDGAFVVNLNGQVLGARVYLSVDHPSLEVPEGCGTRHITAASFSKRKNILGVFSLSEETFTVRKWKEGVFVDQFYPEEKTE